MPITFSIKARIDPPSVNGDGTDLAISADGATVAIASQPDGQVFVYRGSGATWMLDETFEGVPPTFGNGVALSADGTRLVVGNPNDGFDPDAAGPLPDGSGAPWERAGSVSIYARDEDGTWSTQGFFSIDDVLSEGTPESKLGVSVAISADGNTVLAGELLEAVGDPDGGQFLAYHWNGSHTVLIGDGTEYRRNVGAAYILSYGDDDDGGMVWSNTLKYHGQGGPWPDNHAGGQYGSRVFLAADADSGVIFAPLNFIGDTWEGSFFTLGDQQVDADSVGPGVDWESPFFRADLSSDGNTLAVGCLSTDDDEATIGVVQVYRRVDGSWTPTDLLILPDLQDPVAVAPVAVAADGNLLAISNYRGFLIMAYNSDLGIWEQQGDFYDLPSGVAPGEFAYAMAFADDGRTLAVRAYDNTTWIYTRAGISVSFDGIEYAG